MPQEAPEAQNAPAQLHPGFPAKPRQFELAVSAVSGSRVLLSAACLAHWSSLAFLSAYRVHI